MSRQCFSFFFSNHLLCFTPKVLSSQNAKDFRISSSYSSSTIGSRRSGASAVVQRPKGYQFKSSSSQVRKGSPIPVCRCVLGARHLTLNCCQCDWQRVACEQPPIGALGYCNGAGKHSPFPILDVSHACFQTVKMSRLE